MYDANKMQFTLMKSENDTTCENLYFQNLSIEDASMKCMQFMQSLKYLDACKFYIFENILSLRYYS